MGDLKNLFIKEHPELCKEYNELLAKFWRGDTYLCDSKRTKKEIEKWRPIVLNYTVRLNEVMERYEEETGEELIQRGEFGEFKF